MRKPQTLDWNDLRYLLAAARAGTLAGAARELQVEHSTVGRRLGALERTLGGALVLRRPDGLVLTPFGRRVLEAASQAEQAMAAVAAAAAQARVRMRLAVPSGLADLFTSRLDRLRDTNPPIVLELMSGAAPVDLARGDADLAVRLGPVADPDLVCRRLATAGWSLYAAKSYLRRYGAPADPADLRGHRLVGYDPALAATPAARWLEAHSAGADVVVRSREVADMARAAASGAGIALLPCYLADALPSLQRLTPDVLVTRELSLVYRRELRPSPTMQATAKFVVGAIAEEAAALGGRVSPTRAAGAARS